MNNQLKILTSKLASLFKKFHVHYWKTIKKDEHGNVRQECRCGDRRIINGTGIAYSNGTHTVFEGWVIQPFSFEDTSWLRGGAYKHEEHAMNYGLSYPSFLDRLIKRYPQNKKSIEKIKQDYYSNFE